jgi:hypothetical protein
VISKRVKAAVEAISGLATAMWGLLQLTKSIRRATLTEHIDPVMDSVETAYPDYLAGFQELHRCIGAGEDYEAKLAELRTKHRGIRDRCVALVREYTTSARFRFPDEAVQFFEAVKDFYSLPQMARGARKPADTGFVTTQSDLEELEIEFYQRYEAQPFRHRRHGSLARSHREERTEIIRKQMVVIEKIQLIETRYAAVVRAYAVAKTQLS